jgi:hypothetical protein
MPRKEKGRPAGGDPIPTTIRQDLSEFTSQPFDFQVSRLIRRSGLSAASAELFAPFIYGESAR